MSLSIKSKQKIFNDAFSTNRFPNKLYHIQKQAQSHTIKPTNKHHRTFSNIQLPSTQVQSPLQTGRQIKLSQIQSTDTRRQVSSVQTYKNLHKLLSNLIEKNESQKIDLSKEKLSLGTIDARKRVQFQEKISQVFKENIVDRWKKSQQRIKEKKEQNEQIWSEIQQNQLELETNKAELEKQYRNTLISKKNDYKYDQEDYKLQRLRENIQDNIKRFQPRQKANLIELNKYTSIVILHDLALRKPMKK